MLKVMKGWLIFIAILIVLGAGAGFTAVSLFQSDAIPPFTYVDTISIGGMSKNQAKAALKDFYDFFVQEEDLTISINDRQAIIPLRALDMRFEADKTLIAIKGGLESTLTRFILGSKTQIQYPPVFSFNEGKLSASLEERMGVYETDASAEAYTVKGGSLLHQPSRDGIKIDYVTLEKRVSEHLESHYKDVLTLSMTDQTIFTPVKAPQSTIAAFDTIVSSARIPLSESLKESGALVLEEMNGTISQSGKEIILSELMDFNAYSGDTGADFLNRFATGLYQSLLPIDGIQIINRRPAKFPVPYSEPGLEAVVEGQNGDLKLLNDTGKDLMILGEILDGNLDLYIVSTDEIQSGIMIVQKRNVTPPPVIESMNPDLKKGETRVISEGTEGFTVYVNRVIGNERTALYSDQYEPVSRVVETGGEPLKTGSK